MKPKVLIFIITYKASFRVLNLIKKIPLNYLNKNTNYNILISDDNSEDDTIDFIYQVKKNLKSKIILNLNKKNLGYGGNIKKCIKYAYTNNYDFAVMIHGDDQYHPKYVSKMLDLLFSKKNISAVSGSRMMTKIDAIKGKMPIYKFIGNVFLTKLFNLIYRQNFTDCHTGYWAYNLKKINKNIFYRLDNKFCFDIDLRINLVSKKLKILEIPIKTYYGSERSSMHIVYALRFLLKIISNGIFKLN
tara:strand:+ start:121 stop:855 length:735 start_codon:yes stop_codon:yes gene_type:complete